MRQHVLRQERDELRVEVERLREALRVAYASVDKLCIRPGTCLAVRPRPDLSESSTR